MHCCVRACQCQVLKFACWMPIAKQPFHVVRKAQVQRGPQEMARQVPLFPCFAICFFLQIRCSWFHSNSVLLLSYLHPWARQHGCQLQEGTASRVAAASDKGCSSMGLTGPSWHTECAGHWRPAAVGLVVCKALRDAQQHEPEVRPAV